MFTIRFIIQFFNRTVILKALFTILLFSLIPLAEIVLLFQLEEMWGNYFILAIVAITGLFGLFIVFSELTSIVEQVKKKVGEGFYPADEFEDFAGAFISAFCLIAPGFITDVAGLLILLPSLRRLFGRIITNRMPDKLKEIYEYLKLYDS
jgi:UPF0716 protein FxsA